MQQRTLDSTNVNESLAKFATAEFIDTSLRDAVDILRDSYSVPLLIDREWPDPQLPVTLNLRDVSLQSALLALCELHDLDCDYRYGCLWITERDDDFRWSDPTGISIIAPPGDSALQRAWDQPVAEVYADDEPLASVLARLAAELQVMIDTSRVIGKADVFPVKSRLKSLPLRHVLGVLLYETGCRASLDGESLRILPPDN